MLKYLPTITFNFDGNEYFLADITKNISALSSILSATAYYDEYICKDNETLEIISYNKYGSVEYWWVIAIVNKIYDYRVDMALSKDTLLKRLWFKYNLKEAKIDFDVSKIETYLTNKVHHYEVGGLVTHVGEITPFIQQTTIDTSKYDSNELCPIELYYDYNSELLGEKVSVYDYEYKLNEEKRVIKIIQRKYLPQLVSEIQGLMNE